MSNPGVGIVADGPFAAATKKYLADQFERP
jgi:hypothetical protein